MEGPRIQRKQQNTWLTILMALSGAWAMDLHFGLSAADRGQGVFDLLLTAGLFLLFRLFRARTYQKTVRVRSAILGAVFVVLLAVGGDWFSAMRYGKFTNVPLYLLYYVNGFFGTFLLFYFGLCFLMTQLAQASPYATASPQKTIVRRIFLGTFVLCAAVYFVFLLNQYPGSMESDHMRQLKHLLSGTLENRNPLINSLLVWGCVKLALLMGGSMNSGVFLYSILQLLLLSATFAYGVSLLYRAGMKKWILIASTLFCALVPYNIFYSYGMWKDTFFAIWLLMTVWKMLSLLLKNREGERISGWDWLLLFGCALVCSLSRNSGWSALMLLGVCLFFVLNRSALRLPMTGCILGGVALALLLMGPVFTALGVAPTADSVSASCIPLQQVGQVLVDEKELTEEERALIDAVVNVEQVKATFDPTCADPMKDAIYPKIAVFDGNKSDYVRLWLELGRKYPLTYLRAYKNLLRMYYDPNVSSEVAYKWIYENDFGVYRDSKLLPQLDFGYYETLLELPTVNLVKRPGAILWWMLILWQVCALRKSRRSRLLFLPFLAVFGGLFFTAPVALFRYVYSAAAALPFLCCWPYMRLEEHPSGNE